MVVVRRGVHLQPGGDGAGFGVPSWPAGGFLIVKGIRDVVLAMVMVLVMVVLLVTGHRRAAGVSRRERTARVFFQGTVDHASPARQVSRAVTARWGRRWFGWWRDAMSGGGWPLVGA
jgi:hypothetical protein